MRGKKILGMVLVMAMLATAMPLLSGSAKAESNGNSVPSYLVIVRDIPDPNPRIIDKTIGNAYQDNKFGVEVIVHAVSYTYDPSSYDIVKLSITGIGVKGDNAGDYKVKWFEIGSTKFSFEGMKSDTTPHATDYTSGVQATTDPYVNVGLKGSVHHDEITWFKEIAGTVADTATSLAVDAATDGAAGPLSGLVGSGASYLVENAIDSMFNVNQVGRNYVGSSKDPWASGANYPHTYTALRGVTDGAQDDPQKVLLARNLQWNLYDGINDRIHVLTLRATLRYGKYGWHYTETFPNQYLFGWYDEHTISTSVTIYSAPQKMVGMDQSGNNVLDFSKSDPDDDYESYFLEVENHISWGAPHYKEVMPLEDSALSHRCDTMATHKVNLLLGNDEDDDLLNITEHYYYYRGALPPGDDEDWYHVDFIIDINHYRSNTMHLWIFATSDIVVHLNFYGVWSTIHIKGGTSWDLNKKYVGDGSDRWADIKITKDNGVEDAAYFITAYVSYEGYGDGPDGPPNNDHGGCPFLYSYSGDGWREENNVLVWAENATRPTLNTVDYYLFNASESGSRITIGIGEPGEDVDFVDSVRLYKVDAPSGYRVAESYGGMVYAYRDVESGVAVDNDGVNVTNLVDREDGNYWVGEKGDYIDVKLHLSRENLLVIRGIDNPPDKVRALTYRPPTTLSTIWVYANVSGKWVKLGEIKVRHNMHTNVVNLDSLPMFFGNKIELRFEMRDRNGVDFIGVAHDYRIAKLKPVSLIKSSYGYENISARDGYYQRINPGDFVRLNFQGNGDGLYLLKIYGFYFNHDMVGKEIGIVRANETNIAEAKLQETVVPGKYYVLLPLPENYSGICSIRWYINSVYIPGSKPVLRFEKGEYQIELVMIYRNGDMQYFSMYITVF